jgi:hypothetical protein
MRTKLDNNHCIDNSASGLLVPEDIIFPVVSFSALTCSLDIFFYWKLLFLYNVIII